MGGRLGALMASDVDFDLTTRMERGCLRDIPPLPCTRCEWDPLTGWQEVVDGGYLEEWDADLQTYTVWAREGAWPTYARLGIAWIEQNLIFGEGDFFGLPFKPMPDQKLFLCRWYEFCPRCGQWRFKEALRMEATGGGKTQFVAAICLLEFAGPWQIAPESPNIAVAAASWEQADLCFGQAAMMVGGRDDDITEAPLCGTFNVFDTEIRFRGSRPGRMYRTASIAGTNEGGLPHLFVCDELHEWGEEGTKKARVHFVIGKSTSKRRMFWDVDHPEIGRGAGRIINISTAGFDKENSILGTMYMRCMKILQDQTLDPRFLVNIYQARDGLNYDIREDRVIACQDASPAANIIWDVNDRVNEWGKIPNHEWIRYYGNVWPEIVEDSWLVDHPQAWDHCMGQWRSNRKENIWVVAVDMALKQDSVAVNQVEWIPDDSHRPEEGGRFAVTAKIWKAEDYGGRIPHAKVWHYIESIIPPPKDRKKRGGFRGVVYDPRFFEVPAGLLEEKGHQVIEFNQSADQMAPACGLAYKMILEKRIVHDGDSELSKHVRKATAVPMERGGFVLKKSRSMGKIDACIAMVMGVSILHHLPKRRTPMVATVTR